MKPVTRALLRGVSAAASVALMLSATACGSVTPVARSESQAYSQPAAPSYFRPDQSVIFPSYSYHFGGGGE